jgi:hypothetical protein
MSANAWADRHARLSHDHRQRRLERRYRRMLALYPAGHREQHDEEMVGVLLASATEGRLAHLADLTDLATGAIRIRMRFAIKRHREQGLLRGLVHDERWRDALAVASVVAPLVLLVSMLAQFNIPQAVAGTTIGHPYRPLSGSLTLTDWPLSFGAPLVALLAFARLRRLGGLAALVLAGSQLFQLPAQSIAPYSSPALAFAVMLSLTAAAGLLLSAGAARGLAVLRWWGAASIGVGALILGGFSLGGYTLTGYLTDSWATAPPVPGSISGIAPLYPTEVTSGDGDLLIAGVLLVVLLSCLLTPVSRRVLALFVIALIPYAYIWADKLSADLIWSLEGITTIESSSVMLYLPSALVACAIIAGTQLARRRAVSATAHPA